MKAKLFLLSTVFATMITFSLSATVHNVGVSSNQFSPSSITITAGDTVMWTNNGGFHNINGNQATYAANPMSFSNGSASSSSWTFMFKFTMTGTYTYQCDPHAGSGMVGTVIVNPAPIIGIVKQSFEASGDNWPYTINPAAYQASGDIWDSVSSLSVISASAGTNFWGMQDLNNPNGGGNFAHTMDFAAASLAGLSNAKLKFDYYTIGYETADSLAYVVEFNNGTTWGTVTELNRDTQAWTPIEVVIPGGSTHVRVRFYAKQNGGSDYAAIDNVRLDTTSAAPPLAGNNYNIGDVTTSDLAGIADSLNVDCQIRGVIHSIDFDGNAGYSFFMADATGGINVFSFTDVSGYTAPLVGDSIKIGGTISQFNGLTQMSPDSIILYTSGNALRAPMNVFAMDESTEGEYVRLNGFRVVDPNQWPASGSSNVTITNGTDTVTMRIDSDTDIDGTPVPVGSFNVIGAGGQFDNSSPYTAGYQIFPSSLAGIQMVGASTLPLYTIAQITTSDVNGVADSLNVECEIRGTIFSIDFDGNNGYSFFIQDATGGVNVFSFNDVNNYTNPQMGDSIHIFGSIGQFNGLTQMGPDSIVLWGSNRMISAPTVVTALDETTESELVRINGVTMVTPSQWPTSGSSNVDLTDGTNTFVMRIDSDTDIDGSTAPTGVFDVIGAGGQFDNSNPYTSGYQLFPRSLNDIIVAAPTVPTVNFAVATDMVMESVGTVQVHAIINPTSTTLDSITFQASIGSNVTIPGDGFITPLPNLVTGIFKIAVPANEDTVSFSITIIDDAVIEGNETLFVSIVGVNGGLNMGSLLDYQMVVMDNDAPVTGIPSYQIAQVTTSDVNGIADSLNVECKLTGVIYSDDFDGNAGYSFYMADATGGVNVFNFSDVGSYQVVRGDLVRAIGTIAQFNGLTEMVIDSIVILASNQIITPPTLTATLDETTEGEHIRMNNMSLVTPSQWPASGSSNVDITDGTTTFTMRIDGDTDIPGTTPPAGLFDVIGAGAQFDGSNPFTSGYQIFPLDSMSIIPQIATNPTVSFAGSAQSQLETAGTVTVTLPISPATAGAETIKIFVSNGAGATAADYSTTPAAVTDTITLSVAAGATSASFDVAIVDDATQELNEDITFTIADVSPGLLIGFNANHVFTITDNDTPIPTYDIADIVGVNATGNMDSLGVYCKLVGFVTTPQLSATRTDFFFTNATNTAGIKVNRSTLIAYNAVMGDEIRVIGTLSEFNGGIQIDPDSVVVVSSGGNILPTVITTNLGEAQEGRVIRLNGVTMVDTTGWPTANFGNFQIVLATNDTVTLRIDSDLFTSWGPAPLGVFDVIGVGGQFDNSSPYTDGYQILPRVGEEIIRFLATLSITEIMASSNQPSPIDGDWFEITNFGTDPIDLDGYSWDDDSRTIGKHEINSSLIIGANESVVFADIVAADEAAWLATWMQTSTGLRVFTKDDFGPIGFSGLGSGGDEVNLYDDLGQLVSRATYTGTDVTAGITIRFGNDGNVLGLSVSGIDGAYTSDDGDIGSPGNLAPIGLNEFLLSNITLYPNPATNNVSIETGSIEVKEINITNLSGQIISSTSSSESTVQLDLSDLPKGIYMINIKMNDAQATRKLIVQ